MGPNFDTVKSLNEIMGAFRQQENAYGRKEEENRKTLLKETITGFGFIKLEKKINLRLTFFLFAIAICFRTLLVVLRLT